MASRKTHGGKKLRNSLECIISSDAGSPRADRLFDWCEGTAKNDGRAQHPPRGHAALNDEVTAETENSDLYEKSDKLRCARQYRNEIVELSTFSVNSFEQASESYKHSRGHAHT